MYTSWQGTQYVIIRLRAFISFFVLSIYVLLFVFGMFLFLCLIISLCSSFYFTVRFTSLLQCFSFPHPPPYTDQPTNRFTKFSTLRLRQPAYRRSRRGCLMVTANCRYVTFPSTPSRLAVAPRD
jgi:hypothetical protein